MSIAIDIVISVTEIGQMYKTIWEETRFPGLTLVRLGPYD